MLRHEMCTNCGLVVLWHKASVVRRLGKLSLLLIGILHVIRNFNVIVRTAAYRESFVTFVKNKRSTIRLRDVSAPQQAGVLCWRPHVFIKATKVNNIYSLKENLSDIVSDKARTSNGIQAVFFQMSRSFCSFCGIVELSRTQIDTSCLLQHECCSSRTRNRGNTGWSSPSCAIYDR